MLPSEREKIMVEMCLMWPSKYADAELEDFCNRVMRFTQADVLRALNEHKNTQKFAPKISEILGKLKGREVEAKTGEARTDSLPQALRRSNPHWQHLRDDREVLMRYWRSVWFRYAIEAEKRSTLLKLRAAR